MQEQDRSGIAAALGAIPSGLFVLTSAHEDRRGGMLVSWVQQVCFEPPMIMVAVAKGRPIMPLISESRQFALCQIADGDRVMLRKFAQYSEPGEDPFLGFDLIPPQLGVLPILKSSLAYLECELACHMDVEGDHDLFIGAIHAGNRHSGQPRVHIRDSGFHY